jgi:hypothetical protein
LAIQFQPYTEGLKSYKEYQQPYPGHLQRYNFVPKDLDKDRYILFTDTDDVVFQKPLPENLEYDIYLACENVIHVDTVWNRFFEKYPPFQPIQYREVYNCGTYLMKVDLFYRYIDFLNNYRVDDFSKYNFQQLHFNLFLLLNSDLSRVIDLSLFCPLYANFEKGLCYKDEKGIWRTKGGDIISCVHGNGIKTIL